MDFDFKIGDKVQATWFDGLVILGTYVGYERGFVLILNDADGRKVPCSSSVNIKLVVSQDEN